MRVFDFTGEQHTDERPVRRVTQPAPSAASSAPETGLTKRQTEVYQAMLRYQEQHGYPPTQNELSTLLGMKSGQGVKPHLQVLMLRGFVVSTTKHAHRNKMAVPLTP